MGRNLPFGRTTSPSEALPLHKTVKGNKPEKQSVQFLHYWLLSSGYTGLKPVTQKTEVALDTQ